MVIYHFDMLILIKILQIQRLVKEKVKFEFHELIEVDNAIIYIV